MPQYPISPEIYDQSIPQIATAKTVILDFLKETHIHGDETIIDACCGTGNLAGFLGSYLPNCTIIGLDNAVNMIEFAKEKYFQNNVSFLLEDLTSFNESRKKSADFMICSWAVSHIPMEQQKNFTNNLYQYLKKEGQLIILFPIMGSTLSSVIQEVIKSEKWSKIFTKLENNRVTFTVEQYDELLRQVGFIDRKVRLCSEEITFKDQSELRCFIITSLARYLPYIPDPELCEEFINDVTDNYREKIPNLSYTVTILSAIAKRPFLNLLLQNAGAFTHNSNSSQEKDITQSLCSQPN
ncbi:methyltransferase [Legionella santicrucis]|uniref:Methyltransferase n=1 Tax=Legionella santicrucis TaxID=45074 RepID=A0A0W0Y846_9GAMM|nr:class I SAM-dependent methyltransferase [Legionella santicrucis]KTD53112.1 methyltransferase [Legionella santicrucis]